MDQEEFAAGSVGPRRPIEVLATLKLRSSERDLAGAAARIVAFLDEHDEALVDTSPFEPSTSKATVVAKPLTPGREGNGADA